MRTIQFRYLERLSAIHDLRPDAKIVCLVSLSMGIALNLGWGVIGVGWLVLVAAFLLARLPRTMLAPPPRIFLMIVGFSFMFSLFSGGDPVVAGVELGGVLEFAQLLALGLLLVGFAALLTWTTSLTDIGLGLANLLRPLRLVRAPVDELTTVIVLVRHGLTWASVGLTASGIMLLSPSTLFYDSGVGLVAGMENLPAAKMDLKDRWATGAGAGDRHVGHDVLSGGSGQLGQEPANGLDAVLRVAGEANDGIAQGFRGSLGGG